ncbi:Protein disulfide-isomerase [Saliniradius amylolyticus]|uniref:Thiol:disulfide interchange protein n=1 Tax=Saliniradius amylolyticus TaxID=2183582 RepID=A0A2S2E040_9ALTE|nr:bifunctional protein-disulfide isomerase/oxidoreductase DsbC [Saliniradius amylolyticus]AWL11011.1 Protein disulfide-isomerase [Saliniradius amylolyticus]
MKHWIASLTLAALVSAFAVEAETDTEQQLKTTLSDQLGMKVTSLEPAPVEGLYQAVTSRGLFYVSTDGGYLIHGRVYNINKGLLNETEQALAEIRLEGLEQFQDSTIEFKADDERHVITVFTDISCGYCRKLHSQIDEYNRRGITVRYLAFPRGGLNTQTYKDMVSVWCSDEPKATLTAAKAGDNIPANSCENKVRQQYEFGQKVGVNGTPALILDDGSMIPGYQPPARLEQALQGSGS